MELNKAVLDCMQSLRRRLRDELAMNIRLSQPDAVAALLGACLQSSDPETRSLGQRLAEFSDQQDSPAAGSKALYRGHTQAEIASQPALPHASGSVRMYRGQRVYV